MGAQSKCVKADPGRAAAFAKSFEKSSALKGAPLLASGAKGFLLCKLARCLPR